MALLKRAKPTAPAGPAQAPSAPLHAIDITCGDPRVPDLFARLRAEDWEGAQTFFAELRSPYEREFFFTRLSELREPLPVFDHWSAATQGGPGARDALLAHGNHLIGQAWEARGAGRADTVSRAGLDAFFGHLRRADAALMGAADLDPTDPVPWSSSLTTARGLQIANEELCLRFEEADRRCPSLSHAHYQFLQGIARKWSGTHEEMFAFARLTAGEAAPGALLHGLVPAAHLEYWIDQETEGQVSYSKDPGARQQVIEAARMSVLHEHWVDGPYTVSTLNIFACALRVFEFPDEARFLAQRIGTRLCSFPWGYLKGGASAAFERARH